LLISFGCTNVDFVGGRWISWISWISLFRQTVYRSGANQMPVGLPLGYIRYYAARWLLARLEEVVFMES